MTPQEFIDLWDCSYQTLAEICDASYDVVRHWFVDGKTARKPTKYNQLRLEIAHAILSGQTPEISQEIQEILSRAGVKRKE